MCDRNAMQVTLKIAIRCKTDSLGNAHHGCGVNSQTLSERASAEQNEVLRILQNRSNSPPPLAAEMLHINLKPGWSFSVRSGGGFHRYRRASPRKAISSRFIGHFSVDSIRNKRCKMRHFP